MVILYYVLFHYSIVGGDRYVKVPYMHCKGTTLNVLHLMMLNNYITVYVYCQRIV